MIIVADASPLIALAICDNLDILEKLFGTICVSKTVYEEAIVHSKSGADQLEKYLEGKIVECELDNPLINEESLDAGELSSIALYQQLKADYLLIDEKAGRRVAKRNHIKVIGSLGVLIEAKKKGILQSIKPSIEILRFSKIYFSSVLLDHALVVANESELD